jgi:hypothetical protein
LSFRNTLILILYLITFYFVLMLSHSVLLGYFMCFIAFTAYTYPLYHYVLLANLSCTSFFIHVSNMYFLSVYTSELFLSVLLWYLSYTSSFSVCIYVISFCTFVVLHMLLGCTTLVYNFVLLFELLLYFNFFLYLCVISFRTSVLHTLYFIS